MFQYFGQRLKRDLKQLVDSRLEASAISSGSAQKVRTRNMLSTFVLRSSYFGSRPASRSMSSVTNARDMQYGSAALSSPLSWVKSLLLCKRLADTSDSLNFTLLAIPRHSMTRLGRVSDVVTRSSAVRLRCMQFVLLNYLRTEGVSIPW
jgi:hypothetical protein